MPDDHIVNLRRLLDRQLVARDGYLLLPTEPGWPSASMTTRSRATATYPGNSGP